MIDYFIQGLNEEHIRAFIKEISYYNENIPKNLTHVDFVLEQVGEQLKYQLELLENSSWRDH